MNEDLLQYIWLTGLFDSNNLRTKDNLSVEIISRGKLNTDAGPDFSSARIRIGNTEWAGNVEIHIRSEQWYEHQHHTDKAYNNTILHVVLEDNAPCLRADGTELASISLSGRIPENLLENYSKLLNTNAWISCENNIPNCDPFIIHQTINRALVQKQERKSKLIYEWLEKANNDWNTVFYHALARSLGFNTNSEAFEQVAMNIPLSILSRHQSVQNEAMVFGVAGFLLENDGDEYYQKLRNEWQFLQSKYTLKTLEKSSFKFMRMRPGNFPGIRLAQFASIASKCPELFHKMREKIDFDTIRSVFQCEASEYWKQHYHFFKTSNVHSAALSSDAIDHILINAVVPVLFVYGRIHGEETLCEKAMELLHKIPAENNSIIRNWKTLGIEAKTSFESQGLLELKNNNCDAKKCLQCPVGHSILRV